MYLVDNGNGEWGCFGICEVVGNVGGDAVDNGVGDLVDNLVDNGVDTCDFIQQLFHSILPRRLSHFVVIPCFDVRTDWG